MSTILQGQRARIADLLFKRGAIKFASKPGEFKLKLHEQHPEAPLSPIYLMLRTDQHPTKPGPLTKEDMREIGRLLGEKISMLDFDYFTGIPEAGEPFADEVEWITRNHSPRPRRLKLEKKEVNGKRRISRLKDDDVRAGERALLVDDLITQADSKLEAIQALEASGLVVASALVLVDRQQGGREQLERAGYRLKAVFTLDELLDHYVERKVVTSGKAQEVRDYIKDNQL